MQISIKCRTSLFQHFGCENFLSANAIFIDWHDQDSQSTKYYLQKKCRTAFLFYCDAKRSDKHESI